MYTKNISQLAKKFNSILKKKNINIFRGININEQIPFELEDGLPWIEISGDLTAESAKELMQEISNQLDIFIYINRFEHFYGSDPVVFAVFDICPDFIKSHNFTDIAPQYGTNLEKELHLKEYGVQITPQQKH